MERWEMGDGGEDEGGRGGEKRGMEVGEVRWVEWKGCIDTMS